MDRYSSSYCKFKVDQMNHKRSRQFTILFLCNLFITITFPRSDLVCTFKWSNLDMGNWLKMRNGNTIFKVQAKVFWKHDLYLLIKLLLKCSWSWWLLTKERNLVWKADGISHNIWQKRKKTPMLLMLGYPNGWSGYGLKIFWIGCLLYWNI